MSELRLNLGCGQKHLDGYVNIDLPGHQKKPDLECDIRKLPYQEGSVDEIIAIHVFEHMQRHHAIKALGHWFSLLKKDGVLVLEMPCLEKVLKLFKTSTDPYLTVFALYGDQERVKEEGEQQLHRWCWSSKELRGEMEVIGFHRIGVIEPLFHKPVRDMRIYGFKP